MADERFPGAIAAFASGVCLPSFPSLPPEDVDAVADAVVEFYRT